MNFRFVYYLFLFLTINDIYRINSQLPNEYVGLNYTTKSFSLVGTQISVVSGEIEFNQDLYVKKSSSCPNFVCPVYNYTCPPCDYTHSNQFGCGMAPPGCPTCSNYEEFAYANYPCNTTLYSWEDLEINKPLHRITAGNGVNHTSYSLYRYYPGPECQGYKVSLNYYKGVGKVQVDFIPFNPAYDGVFKSVFSHEIDSSITLCPSLTAFDQRLLSYYPEYPYSTIFISVTNENLLEFEYDIVIEPITVHTNSETCTQVEVGIPCVPDGAQVTELNTVEQGSFVKYSFTITECKDITIVTNFLLNDIDLFVGETPDISNTNFKWSSTYSIDENLLIYLCPDPGQSNKTIYFGIYAFYETNYEFFVQTNAQIKMLEITEGPIFTGQWRLYTTSYIKNTKTGKELRCDNYDRECFEYFPLYPRKEISALYPVPGIFFADGFYSDRYQEIFLNPSISTNEPKSKTYQFGVILSLTVDGVLYSYNDQQDLESMELHFLNRIFKKDGTPITGVIPLKGHSVVNQCSYEKFQEVVEQINHIVENLDDVTYDQINSYRYGLDLKIYDDRYYSCKAMAESFLNFTTVSKTLDTKLCAPTNNLTQYFDDPCCSIYARYGKCCRTREKEMSYQVLSNVDENLVEENCAFSSCAISVLTDFAESLVGNQYDPCKVTSEDEDTLSKNLYETFRKCKIPLYSTKKCDNDQTCRDYYNSSSAYCSIRKRFCDVPHEGIDKFYITCIIDNILPPLKHEVLSLYNISTTISSKEAALQLYPHMLSYDCTTNYNFQTDIRYFLMYVMDRSVVDYCFGFPSGQDKSIEQPNSDSCYIGIFKAVWLATQYGEDLCNQFIRCDWMGQTGGSDSYAYDDLEQRCNQIPTSIVNSGYNFCGECSDPFLNCYSDLTIQNQTTCESSHICYFPDDPEKPPVRVSDDEDCIENYGSCNVACSYECGGSSCVIPRDSSSYYCPPISHIFTGTPIDDPTPGGLGAYCSYTLLTPSVCSSNGGTMVDCSQFSFDECSLCNNSDSTIGCASFGAFCQPTPIPCPTKETCEAGGKCSDSVYFEKKFGIYPTYKPKCLYSRYYELNKNSSQPGCQIPYTQDSPYGCFEVYDPTLFDQTLCEDFGGIQWSQSFTQGDCESFPPVCSGTDNFPSDYYLPYTRRYNDKSEDDCVCAGQTWDKPFVWSPGVWTPGSPATLKWTSVNQTQPYTKLTTYKPVLFHEKLFNEFSNAKFKRTSLLYKSEILCRISNVKDALESLSCSCTTDGGSSCFDIINPPVISVIKPCFESVGEYPILVDDGLVIFYKNSIALGSCISISIAEVSQYTFLSKKIVALSAGFVSYRVPGDYSIYNDNKAAIGQIQSNGVEMDFFDNGTNFFELCLKPSIDTDSTYTVQDIGFVTDENEGIVEPLECDMVMRGDTYCCNVTKIEKVSKYILLKRIENWKDEPYQPFSKSARNMLYVLAVVFLILTIYGLGNLGFFIFLKLFATEPFKLVHLLFFFLTVFSLIRSIYFFILPRGTVLDQSAIVGEYILVVLPTFLYFTSFTIVVVIWYTLTSSSFNTDIYKRMFKLIITINTILYCLFIAIVLVFNFTKKDPPPTCGGRILAEYSNSSPQKVVSILYAVLQSVLSLAIGLAFIYYGRKIYLRLSEIKRDQSISQKKRILYIGVICSTGFVLHCIFIIILVSANPSNIVFSFIGLIITEIVPVSTLFFFNNQFPWLKLKQTAIKQLSRSQGSQGSESEKTHNTMGSTSVSMRSKKDSSRSGSHTVEPITILK